MSGLSQKKFDELKSRAIYWREILARPENAGIVSQELRDALRSFGQLGILYILADAPLGYELAQMVLDEGFEKPGKDDWEKMIALARQIIEQADGESPCET